MELKAGQIWQFMGSDGSPRVAHKILEIDKEEGAVITISADWTSGIWSGLWPISDFLHKFRILKA